MLDAFAGNLLHKFPAMDQEEPRAVCRLILPCEDPAQPEFTGDSIIAGVDSR